MRDSTNYLREGAQVKLSTRPERLDGDYTVKSIYTGTVLGRDDQVICLKIELIHDVYNVNKAWDGNGEFRCIPWSNVSSVCLLGAS